MSGNDVPIKEEERWFKDGVDPEASSDLLSSFSFSRLLFQIELTRVRSSNPQSTTIPEGHWSLSEPLQ